MAEKPTYLSDKGTPSFNLTWYFGSGVKAGGICTMTVALPMPDTDNPQVKSKFVDAIRGDTSTSTIAKTTLALCKAMDANDATKVASLKAELGFNDEAAAKRKATWDGSDQWEQFLPDSNIKIAPILYTSGKVVVQAFANKEAYDGHTPTFTGAFETTPSQFNSNAAVITFNLSDLGANLFWHGLGGWAFDQPTKPEAYDVAAGASSVLTVVYTVTFDGLLPEARATVSLKHEVLAKLNIEEQVKTGAWGRTYRQEVVRGKEFNDAINSATEIVLPAVASPNDKKNVQELLTDWAAKQLEVMTQAQLPSVSLADLRIEDVRQIKTVQEQARTYKLTQAVTLPKSPQAQLSKINALVDEKTVRNVFQLINLNDVPHIKVDLTVRPPNIDYMKTRQIDRFVVTQLTFAGQKLLNKDAKEVASIEYLMSKDQPNSEILNGVFGRDTKDKTIQYSYLVSYNDGTPPFRVSAASQTDNNYLDLGGVDIGVLSVSLDATGLPWDVISSAKVDLRYADWEKSIALKKDSAPVLITKPFGQTMSQPLSYKVTLTLTAGMPIVGEVVEVMPKHGHAEITLQNPLGNMIDPITFTLEAGVTKAQLRVEYTLRSSGTPDRIFNQLVQLDSSKDSGKFVWNVPRQSNRPPAMRVTKARVTSAAGVKDLTDLSQGALDPLDTQASITVLADGLSNF
ncbi:hypothetical protein FVF58_44565 [Paraburkholderia panacisoli]|uniref:Uncharacterized protein n=1 Tax=Paraburkholderia panacisoli TaxID=2603818 RepID=A0A5B0G5F1_9BURK|nr:hypothetical protein [Paraburkholderia panacisoli]KAA0998452.1 hypothetical protein FVF58_44565 [Paraburkholderia panacisoli]